MNKYKLLDQLSIPNKILLGSTLCTLYFLLVRAINHYKIYNIMIGFIGELVTIPFVLLTATLFIYTIWAVVTKKIQLQIKIAIAFLLQVLCIYLITR
jgi:hypothetical protein